MMSSRNAVRDLLFSPHATPFAPTPRSSPLAYFASLHIPARASFATPGHVSLPNAIDKWFFPLHNTIMATKLTLDKAGRVVLPKPLRDRLQLAPGDTLHLESEGERITLRPVRQSVMLKKELGVWVYQGEPSDTSIPDLVDREREDRHRSVTESVTE